MNGAAIDLDREILRTQPDFVMDNDGIPLGPKMGEGRMDMAMYASITNRKGQVVLWYPDRKFFVLGKKISQDFIADLRVL